MGPLFQNSRQGRMFQVFTMTSVAGQISERRYCYDHYNTASQAK